MNEKPTVIEATGLHRHFSSQGVELKVLRGIDLHVEKGEMVAVLGLSGVGKSTLLNLLGLLDTPSAGKIFYHTEDRVIEASTLTENERAALRSRFIGFVFQFFHLLPDLDLLENVLLPAMVSRSSSDFRRERRQLEARARELIEHVGLTGREKQAPNTLSGGERQRVAIARGLMNDPALLLCDEPSGNLDSVTSEKIHRLFKTLSKTLGTTILTVTHDPYLAARADRRLTMVDGRFVKDQEN
ncbi:MAG TPA: ABC transporter ATP-binding protein [Planctomycetes bacterium]|nr:ABC transporter ATP-binding protein [Planctomycetota bacterium]HIN81005.1 ABC transporter ATP-binding protein [Planctomycetota bacterium]